MITNADKGALLTWEADTPEYCASTVYSSQGSQTTGGCVSDIPASSAYGLATTQGDSLAGVVSTDSLIYPGVQTQDGTFVGSNANGMVAFDQYGNQLWTVPNDGPQIATADGGVIGYSGVTYDSQGRATGQIANLPIPSWMGNQYQYGSTDQVLPVPISTAMSFAAFQGGNPSGSGTAAPLYEPQVALRTIASSHLTGLPACNTFLDNLTAIAISNGRAPGGRGSQKRNYLPRFGALRTQRWTTLKMGQSSTTLWDQCTPPNCVAKFPVWFTGEQKPNGYLVKQEFEDNGPGTFHYLEGLSQYNGDAIWLRLFYDWSGAWKGLLSQYVTKLPLSKMGQVNRYGLGTLLHEVLHKQSIGGGFTHANMSQALGIGSCAPVGTQNGCSNAIAAACFLQ